MHRGIATFTLDYGRCPKWLFERMTRLGREIVQVMIAEYGPDEFIKRIADPVWFQSLGTVLAFDWNASGLTTILTAALKEAIRGEERDLGIFICGGKGKTSRKTPEHIQSWGNLLRLPEAHTKNLIYNSRMAAKIDSALVQDSYQIYHHTFFFSCSGAWSVVQQGMNIHSQTARRYHWYSQHINDLVCEPHSGIASQIRKRSVLNLTAKGSDHTRDTSTALVQQHYRSIFQDFQLLEKYSSKLNTVVRMKIGKEDLTLLSLHDEDFHSHPVLYENFSKSKYLQKIFWNLCEKKPKSYESLLSTPGVGPKTIRALALVAEIIYGAKPSYEDPARYSFAHGGKDAIPYPIDRQTYNNTIAMLQGLVLKTRLNPIEKDKAIKRICHTA
ncbi:MAG: DUF763 domain-containing protein [Candidatus Colwellbacteria bacterium]|nr:DUF763 domain-containing protein [Candidatus Colwellbacteria bacterium]